eukprot:TRINITY_DN12484_c2_g3_i1.p2 TRINITY_DN12484_c2_g3~~TRINITY_DN12484_c2_g3_i1.p2  ORF type:complete len:420 (-),score=73.88 TRINITY_DN12484_c2_g3_i1:3364-4623(-)
MHDDLSNFNGTIHARGGASGNEFGGAGTVYIEGTNGTALHRVLRVDNDGAMYPWQFTLVQGLRLGPFLDGDYGDVREIGGVTWLHPDSDTTEYVFEELDIRGNAHVAVLPGLHGTDTHPHSVDAKAINGDRTGRLHIARNQTVSIDSSDIYFPVSVYLYETGYLNMPGHGRTNLREVFFEINGTFGRSSDITVDVDGRLHLTSRGNSPGLRQGAYKFDHLRIKPHGLFRVDAHINYTDVESTIVPEVESELLFIHAGGNILANWLHLKGKNVEIDKFGEISADFGGYPMTMGRGAGLPTVKIGGSVGVKGTGGSHGGRGGLSLDRSTTSFAYDSAFEPVEFGSGGGLGSDPALTGGSRGGGILRIELEETLRLEGRIHANGEDSIVAAAYAAQIMSICRAIGLLSVGNDLSGFSLTGCC